MSNIDKKTVSSFGDEWKRFNQEALKGDEHSYLFEKYFHIFPWDTLPKNANGFDMGCGSGRWAKLVAPKIGKLSCIDPSIEALSVAKRSLAHLDNIIFLKAGVSDEALPSNSQDFGYSLGVLHHIPDTQTALSKCVDMLKPGAPFLLYLYYKFDNRPIWYVFIWRITDMARRMISIMPSSLKSSLTNIIANVSLFSISKISFVWRKNWLES